MTTKNILILSIILAELLFLGYTSAFEFSPLNAEEMKTAVSSTLQKNTELKMITEAKKKIAEEREKERQCVLDEAERISCNQDEEPWDGTITITYDGIGSGIICIIRDEPTFEDFVEKQQKRFLNFQKKYGITVK